MDLKNTFSRKDKIFLVVLMFLHFSFVFMAISLFGWFWHDQTESCQKIWKKLELVDWATEQVDKVRADYKLESLKQDYKNHGISAEEY